MMQHRVNSVMIVYFMIQYFFIIIFMVFEKKRV